MATKAELEAEVASLQVELERERRRADRAEVVQRIPPPSPVDRGQMYVESHPTLGVLRTVRVTSQSNGDGRVGDGAEIVRS